MITEKLQKTGTTETTEKQIPTSAPWHAPAITRLDVTKTTLLNVSITRFENLYKI